MPQKQQKDIKEKTIEAALRLAEKKGWHKTTLVDIAKAAKIPLSRLHEHFEDKTDIIIALGRMIDRKILEVAGEPDFDISVKERLFDILMERFDVLNEYRGGIVAVLDSLLPDPRQALIAFPHLCRSMTWMLEAAGVDTAGMAGAVRITGLTAIYIKILCVWKNDHSEDLSKTMAALDKALSRTEQLANMIGM